MEEPPELFQLKCLSPTLEARPHLNRNNTYSLDGEAQSKYNKT
jgi:hypothetical protein